MTALDEKTMRQARQAAAEAPPLSVEEIARLSLILGSERDTQMQMAGPGGPAIQTNDAPAAAARGAKKETRNVSPSTYHRSARTDN